MYTKNLKCFMLPALIFLLLFSGCGADGLSTGSLPEPHLQQSVEDSSSSEVPDSVEQQADDSPQLGLTYLQPDGNRIVTGAGGNLMHAVDITLNDVPLWIVAAPLEGASRWFVALQTGEIQIIDVSLDGKYGVIPADQSLPAGSPPVVALEVDSPQFITPPEMASPSTHPFQSTDGSILYIDQDRNLVMLDPSGGITRFAVNALPDARILSDGNGRYLLLSDPTGAYPHGVLGDALEAGSITLVSPHQDQDPVRVIPVSAGDVIEGILPIWEDLDGDGGREIIVTQSNSREGSRIVVYSESGQVLVQSSPIGTGNRWMHQIAAAQFIPGGNLEIAAVRTPHIGGILQIFTFSGGRLQLAAELGGYSSHRTGSRNLDSAMALDFNGDGLVELVLPNQRQDRVAGVEFGGGVLHQIWELALPGRLSTNLSALKIGDGKIALAAGTEEKILRVWITD